MKDKNFFLIIIMNWENIDKFIFSLIILLFLIGLFFH